MLFGYFSSLDTYILLVYGHVRIKEPYVFNWEIQKLALSIIITKLGGIQFSIRDIVDVSSKVC
jgi:hypothetical protein